MRQKVYVVGCRGSVVLRELRTGSVVVGIVIVFVVVRGGEEGRAIVRFCVVVEVRVDGEVGTFDEVDGLGVGWGVRGAGVDVVIFEEWRVNIGVPSVDPAVGV